MKCYTVTATGDTYHVREDLQSWGFFWNHKTKEWVRESVDEHDLEFFQLKVLNPDKDLKIPWTGVKLTVKEEEQVVSDEDIATFMKGLERK